MPAALPPPGDDVYQPTPWLVLVPRFLGFIAACTVLRLVGRLTPKRAGMRFARLVRGLGPIWVRLGSMIASLSDAFPAWLAADLRADQAWPRLVPFDRVRDTIATDYGYPLDRVFATFEPDPVRGTSVSQTHRATLRGSGREVFVQILRPDAAVTLRRNLRVVTWMIRALKWSRFTPAVRWDDLVSDLTQAVTADTDMRYRIAHANRLRTVFRRYRVLVTRPVVRLTTKHVMVYPALAGPTVADVAAAPAARAAAWLAENKIDRRRVGDRLFRACVAQHLTGNLVLADWGPDNLMLLRGGRVAIVHLDVISSLERDFLRRYVSVLHALAQRQYIRAVELTLLLAPHMPAIDLPGLEQDMVRSLREWDTRARLRSMPYRQQSLAVALAGLARTMADRKITQSPVFLRLARVWAGMDDTLTGLCPGRSYERMFRAGFADAQRTTFRSGLTRKSAVRGVTRLAETVTEYQDLIAPILRRGAIAYQDGIENAAYALVYILRPIRLALAAFLVLLLLRITQFFWSDLFGALPYSEYLADQVSAHTDFQEEVTLMVAALTVYALWVTGAMARRWGRHNMQMPGVTSTRI
ncbi:MAG: AarF/UbiB family protein [Fimbriiglobus sp.]